MSKPIKETPVLKGHDAIKFNAQIEKSKHLVVSTSIRQRVQSNYLKLKAIAKF